MFALKVCSQESPQITVRADIRRSSSNQFLEKRYEESVNSIRQQAFNAVEFQRFENPWYGDYSWLLYVGDQ